MHAGASTLSYAVGQDFSETTNWGDTQFTDTEAGAGRAQGFTVFGHVPGRCADYIDLVGCYRPLARSESDKAREWSVRE
jgi:hypothetical protein